MVFEQNFVPKSNTEKSLFKRAFTIINRQQPARGGLAELADSRVWVTKVYQGVYSMSSSGLGLQKTYKRE